MKTLFIIISGLLIIYGCPTYDPPQKLISIYNYTDSAIYVYYSCSDSLSNFRKLYLFDTINNITNAKGESIKGKIHSPNYRINAYEYGYVGVPARESSIKNCRDGKMKFFFIKEKTMREKTWDEIYKNQLYEKKVILSTEDLIKNDWEVTYP